jgi:hypothetical protein
MRKPKSARVEVLPDSSSPFQQLLETAPAKIGRVASLGASASLCFATIATAESADRVSVVVAGSVEPTPARVIAHVTPADVGREVVVGFELGQLDKPIVLGFLGGAPSVFGRDEVEVQANRLSIEGEQQVVIRCGSASITLTESGKILIKGDYVSSRATGTNRVRGGSVQIN